MFNLNKKHTVLILAVIILANSFTFFYLQKNNIEQNSQNISSTYDQQKSNASEYKDKQTSNDMEPNDKQTPTSNTFSQEGDILYFNKDSKDARHSYDIPASNYNVVPIN